MYTIPLVWTRCAHMCRSIYGYMWEIEYEHHESINIFHDILRLGFHSMLKLHTIFVFLRVITLNSCTSRVCVCVLLLWMGSGGMRKKTGGMTTSSVGTHVNVLRLEQIRRTNCGHSKCVGCGVWVFHVEYSEKFRNERPILSAITIWSEWYMFLTVLVLLFQKNTPLYWNAI